MDVDDLLSSAGLPDPDVSVDDAWAHVATRGRRRRQRRRGATAGALALVSVLGAVAFISASGDQSADVATDGGPSDVPATEELPQLTVAPDDGLMDGDVVTIDWRDDQEGEFTAVQCAASAGSDAANVAGPCSPSVFYLRSPAGRPDNQFVVSRTISTVDGIIDCAERPGRCVIAATQGGGTPFTSDAPTYTAPISFDGDQPVLEPASVDIQPTGPIENGQYVEVLGEGFRGASNQEPVLISVCDAGSGAVPSDSCDLARTTRVDVGPDGRFEVDVFVSDEILTYASGGWQRCTECVLQVTQPPEPILNVALTFLSESPPGRPAAEIVELGPYSSGQEVTLVGSGFQGIQDIQLGSCVDPLEQQPSDCSYDFGFPIDIQSDGTLRATARLNCPPNIPCHLAWIPGEGAPPVFAVPFQTADP